MFHANAKYPFQKNQKQNVSCEVFSFNKSLETCSVADFVIKDLAFFHCGGCISMEGAVCVAWPEFFDPHTWRVLVSAVIFLTAGDVPIQCIG